MSFLKHTITLLLLLGVFLVPTSALAETAATTPTSTNNTEVLEDALVPNLSVDIPGISFSSILNNDGVLQVNYLADYVGGLYKYLIGFGTTIAIVFIMIGGFQYSLGGMASEQVSAGRKKIGKAVVGLSLLLSIYLILFTINPQTTYMKALELVSVDGIALNFATSGVLEGGVNFIDRAICDAIVGEAKANGTCNITQTVGSPTGTQPNCGNHHWFDRGTNGEWKKVDDADYAAPWGQEILSPIDGTVTYRQWSDNMCGNEILITGVGAASGAKLSICHAKDFIGQDGTYQQNRTVRKGEVVGHLGGECCAGQSVPSGWTATSCDVAGTLCDPFKGGNCDCQTGPEAGNTSGPHVHITWYPSGGDFLTCLEY